MTSHEDPVDIAYSPNGQLLAVLDYSREGVWLWDVTTRQISGDPIQPRPLTCPHGMSDCGLNGVQGFAFSPDGAQVALAVGYSDKHAGALVIVDLVTRRATVTRIFDGYLTNVVFSPDGSYIAAIGPEPVGLHLWDAASQLEREVTLGGSGGRHGGGEQVTFNADGSQLVGVGQDEVAVYDVRTGKKLGTFGRDESIAQVKFSGDGRYLVDTTPFSIELRNATTKEKEGEVLLNSSDLSGDIALSPDGQTLATVWRGDGYFEVARLWDLSTLMPIGPDLTH